MTERNYLVYLLQSTTHSGRTYIGSTFDMARRLRQHNGQITGGAKRTHVGRPWTVVRTVHGFQTHQQALQFEWAFAHPFRRGVPARLANLQKVLAKERWTSNAPLASSVPLRVVETAEEASEISLDAH